MLNPIETDSAVPTVLAPPDETVASSDSGGRSPLTILLACLLLALTLVLLSFALLLLILRNGNRMGRKRRTLFIFRKSEKGGEELGGLVDGRKSQMSNGNTSTIPNIKSVLLLNAQPEKRPELERFARLLVKNGVRVFYDRWDRISIERNLQFWVHQAITKADKAVLFWDHRAEKLLNPLSDDNGVKLRIPKRDSSNSSDDNDDLFDRVFCALHQQLDPEKTIYVKWDESTKIDDRPIGSISETVFLFHRDLKLIYAALKIPITEQELREFEHRNMLGRTPQNRPESLLVLIPKFAKKKIPEKVELLTHIEGNNERERNIEETLPEGNEERDEGIYSGTYTENLTIKKPEIMPEKELEKNGKIAEKIAKNNKQNDAAQFDSGIESALHL